eukprot:CCRYP_017026-RA/>CCRYP_017026-RA protein AED:0.21 eAED:0.21 QI:0/0.5/0.33/1/0/0/3/270/67
MTNLSGPYRSMLYSPRSTSCIASPPRPSPSLKTSNKVLFENRVLDMQTVTSRGRSFDLGAYEMVNAS